jgi:GT2 family glycosyltransferase
MQNKILKKIGITIAIPTYNRVSKMLARVDELLRQISDSDTILIIDNATPGFIPDNHKILKDKRIKLEINSSNIGGNANFIKCFEYCHNEWLWLLSDDDLVLEGAIKKIRDEIHLFPSACLINFNSSILKNPRNKSVVALGLNEFLDKNDGFGNTLLISNNVFNIKHTLSYMKFAYVVCGLNAPHLAPIIKNLEDGGSAVYSCEEIVTWEKPNFENSWSISSVYNLLFLTDILSCDKYSNELRVVIAKSLPMPEFLTLQLAHSAKLHNDFKRAKEFNTRILNTYIESHNLHIRCRAYFLKILFNFPSSLLLVSNIFHKFIFKKSIYTRLQDKEFSFFL